MSRYGKVNSWLDLISSNKKVTCLVGTGQLVFLCVCYFVLKQSMFTQDTWSYFELSKTIFSDRFYVANTIRSYLYFPQSASFPFGYPLVLALVNSCLEFDPLNSVATNIVCAVMSFVAIVRLSTLLSFPNTFAAALASSLLMYPGYIDEVLAGRSLPLAIASILVGLVVGLTYPAAIGAFISGLFLGFSVLVRFDFLTHAVVTIILFWYLRKGSLRSLLILFLGFFIGVLPWVAYSYLYFHKLWISDNSWVAIASYNAFVLDFPAKATSDVFSNPHDWLKKIGWNSIRLIYHFLKALILNPLLLVVMFCFFKKINCSAEKHLNSIVVILIAVSLTLAPYAMTGYFNTRYFTYILFGLTVLLICFLKKDGGITAPNPVVLAMVVVVSFAIGVGSVLKSQTKRVNADEITQMQGVHDLDACQKMYTDYSFVLNEDVISFKYGAVTQNKTTIIPSNFKYMNERQKEDYRMFLGPHLYVGNLLEFRCPADVNDFAKHQL